MAKYRLKKDVEGWIKALSVADQDFRGIVPKGTVVNVHKEKDHCYVTVILEGKKFKSPPIIRTTWGEIRFEFVSDNYQL